MMSTHEPCTVASHTLMWPLPRVSDTCLCVRADCTWHLLVQADSGAQAVQIFDSWASHLAPQDFDVFAGPYIKRIIDDVKSTHPDLPIILYISGSGAHLRFMVMRPACSQATSLPARVGGATVRLHTIAVP